MKEPGREISNASLKRWEKSWQRFYSNKSLYKFNANIKNSVRYVIFLRRKTLRWHFGTETLRHLGAEKRFCDISAQKVCDIWAKKNVAVTFRHRKLWHLGVQNALTFRRRNVVTFARKKKRFSYISAQKHWDIWAQKKRRRNISAQKH